MPAEIDLDRLFHVLDNGREAQARARALGEETELLRAELNKAKIALETSVVQPHRKEPHPANKARVDALQDQLRRLSERRQALLPELNQRTTLAAACWRYARAHQVEVSGYAF